jgi:F-type H+-transporting ATPase subunit b
MRTLFFTLLLITLLAAPAAAAEGHHGGAPLLPFVFQVINFLLLLIVLYKLALPKVKGFFVARSQSITESLRQAEDARKAAEAKAREYEDKLKALTVEVEQLRKQVESEAAIEKERIIAEAHKEVEAITAQARLIAEQEIKRAKQELRREAGRLSLERAEAFIRDKITDNDRDRFIKDYIKEITAQSC